MNTTISNHIPTAIAGRSGRRYRHRLIGGLVAGGLLLAACGNGEAATETAQPAAPAAADDGAQADPAPSPAADVLAGTTNLGQVLIGPDGRTLYGFTNDVAAASTCYGTCADAWPPVIVTDDWTAGPGLDFGIFATTVRDDGRHQLVAGAWPLYYFAGDAVAGDLNGQGSGSVWFAVDLDGSLIEDDVATGTDSEADAQASAAPEATAPAAASEADSDLGPILVDQDGLTLYGFLNDREADGPSCNDACADAWPPALVDGPALPAGLDPTVFSVVPRADGSHQLQAGIWPLYRFAGDAAPGELKGQGSGDVWFAAAPDGILITDGATDESSEAETDVDTADNGDDPASTSDGYGYGT